MSQNKILRVNSITQATTVRIFQFIFVTLDPRMKGQKNWGSPTSIRAYCEQEVIKDCMFRCLDIVDPDNVDGGVILRLEHEVRSVLKEDGSLYKSCPFLVAPDGCVI